MNYSLRKKNTTVKYIIIHYTGMKNFQNAYLKLNNSESSVSCHDLISREGLIYNLLSPNFKAWHAGKSKWKSEVNLNEKSIGIELENKGHEHGYSSFTNKQYEALINLINFYKKNYFLKDYEVLFHSDIAPNRKIDPGEKFFFSKLEINKFNKIKKLKKFYSLNEMLRIYGFHKYYIYKYKFKCIEAVKRSLNYKVINSKISNKFVEDFNNLLFY